MLDELRERADEAAPLMKVGYERALDELQALWTSARRFGPFVLDLEPIRNERFNITTPVEAGRGLARKQFYTACLAIQRASVPPPNDPA